MSSRLDSLAQGFRERYLDYAGVTAQLKAWAEAFPESTRLESLGETPEGRQLWLLTIGKDLDRVRPAVWVDGNMHASELCGSSVALAIAEDMLRIQVDAEPPPDLPAPIVERLRDVVFHVMPRMSPDGAEAVLTVGQFVRSVPRDDRPARAAPRWICEDANGDGVARVMRQEDPGGEYVESPDAPGVLLPRRLEDEGPYYKLYPEGRIENFDGNVPDPHFMSDNTPDLNRNFPWSWAPDHEQVGAGSFPASEVESRAVVEFATRHPNLFAWLNLHTYGGVFIRPLGHLPDTKMAPSDLAIFRQVEEWGDEFVGYPTVSGFEEFTYEPEQPLHGDLSDYAYNQRGCIGYVCELWDLFEQLGLPKKKRFVDRYTQIERDDVVKLARWDRENNESRVFPAWEPFEHPQLGAVEVGGFDPRIGVWNPPYSRIDEICRGQASMFLRIAAMAPKLELSVAQHVQGPVTRVEATVTNTGYLPTCVLESAKKLSWNEPVWAEATPAGCELLGEGDSRHEIGHLTGWGRGKYEGLGAFSMPRSLGTQDRRTVSWHVRGRGQLKIRAGAPRMGHVTTTVEVGE